MTTRCPCSRTTATRGTCRPASRPRRPAPGEASTGQARDIGAEVAALAAVVPRVVQAYRPSFFVDIDLRTLPCAVVGDTWTGPELDGFELAVIDLSGCA